MKTHEAGRTGVRVSPHRRPGTSTSGQASGTERVLDGGPRAGFFSSPAVNRAA
ncbi:hypothetical protein [Actinomadura rugatobispora]|uniref:DUF397 domain-containing protein n=1 Tax=Actinomadura rugatobispora TaxID=1994 RepID=A0ABW1A0B6_9ACTN